MQLSVISAAVEKQNFSGCAALLAAVGGAVDVPCVVNSFHLYIQNRTYTMVADLRHVLNIDKRSQRSRRFNRCADSD